MAKAHIPFSLVGDAMRGLDWQSKQRRRVERLSPSFRLRLSHSCICKPPTRWQSCPRGALWHSRFFKPPTRWQSGCLAMGPVQASSNHPHGGNQNSANYGSLMFSSNHPHGGNHNYFRAVSLHCSSNHPHGGNPIPDAALRPAFSSNHPHGGNLLQKHPTSCFIKQKTSINLFRYGFPPTPQLILPTSFS